MSTEPERVAHKRSSPTEQERIVYKHVKSTEPERVVHRHDIQGKDQSTDIEEPMEGPTDKNKPAAVLRKLNKMSATIPKAKIRVKKTKKVSAKDPTFNQRSIKEFLIANNTNSKYEEHTQQLKILGAPVHDGLCPVSILEGGAVGDSPGI